MSSIDIPPEVAAKLGYYVYLYIDPRSERPFYVGKGVGNRVLAHFSDEADSAKTQVLRELRELKMQPRLEILTHGLRDEETAFRIEAAVIDLLGIAQLTNAVRGWKSIEFGRMSLQELLGYYGAKPVSVTHPALLIRVNKEYRHNMSELELYEATRGAWKVGIRREGAQYAMAIFEGVVKEVYVIDSWHAANTTPYQTRTNHNVEGRWEFLGEVAPPDIRDLYVDMSVRDQFKKGLQNPVCYVNC